MIAPGEIVVITGIMAAGKSTVAQALAERLPLSVHLRGDLFRRMIVNGQAEITPGNWEDAERQLRFRQRLACQAAVTYAADGFTVVYQDIILGGDLTRVVDLLDPARQPVSVVVLAPRPEVAARRDRERSKTGYGAWTATDLDASLRRDTPRLGLWLDTSGMTVDESIEAILRRHGEARVPPGQSV
jgi:chloramphenicol 3-O-phosphotransferase